MIIVYIFTILPKISILIFCLKFFSFLFYPILALHFPLFSPLRYIFIGCSLISIFIGSLGAVIK